MLIHMCGASEILVELTLSSELPGEVLDWLHRPYIKSQCVCGPFGTNNIEWRIFMLCRLWLQRFHNLFETRYHRFLAVATKDRIFDQNLFYMGGPWSHWGLRLLSAIAYTFIIHVKTSFCSWVPSNIRNLCVWIDLNLSSKQAHIDFGDNLFLQIVGSGILISYICIFSIT
jgi:hypothetical protein